MNTPQPHPDPPVNSFDKEERLFHAVEAINVKDGKTVLPDAIKFRSLSTSCNREKYRDFPEAVLSIFSDKPELGYLYVAIAVVGNMPPPETVDEQVYWELFVEHIPFEMNYSHTEIRARRIGKEYYAKADMNPRVKLALKASLAGRMAVIKRYAPKT